MYRVKIFLSVVLFLLSLLSCGKKNAPESVAVESCETVAAVLPSVVCPGFDETQFVHKVEISFKGGAVESSELPQGIDVAAEDGNILVNSSLQGVEYILSGDSQCGTVTIISEHSPLVTLNGLSLVSVGENTLQVSSKDIIYIRATGVVSLADKAVADGRDKQAAVLKLMGRALFVGDGVLALSAERRNAILVTDTMYVASGDIVVHAAKANAVLANKGVCMYGGSLNAKADKDVLRSKDDLYLYGGKLVLSSLPAKADAVQVRNLYCIDGEVGIDVAGEAADGIKAKGDMVVAGGRIEVKTSGGAQFSEKKYDYSSASCIKCDSLLRISGGVLSLMSCGDGAKGISVDGGISVSGGDIKVRTTGNDVNHPIDLNAHASCKGIKCDGSIEFAGGSVDVAVLGKGSRAEGVESKGSLTICGDARLYVYAYDDAVNAGTSLLVNGGSTFVYSVTNDAVDSNGKIEINGGVLVAEGASSPEQGIDTDNPADFILSGGTLITVGGSMGPSPCLPMNGATDACAVVWSGLKLDKGCYISLVGSDGKALLSYRVAYGMDNGAVVIAAPGVKKGDEVTLVLSKGIKGGDDIGHGLYSGAVAESAVSSFSLELESLLSVVHKGNVGYIEPGSTPDDMMMPPPPPMPPGDTNGFPPPPPPGGANGDFPPPPPHGSDGKFPPPPPPFVLDTLRVNSYNCEVLPNYRQ